MAPIPGVTGWGLAALGALLDVALFLLRRRRRSARPSRASG
ncbi:MAG: hypothetical protein HY683_00665 [Chloroflexi bacterium]|nr:hypothetical protein [Chloroflexota bacterium]